MNNQERPGEEPDRNSHDHEHCGHEHQENRPHQHHEHGEREHREHEHREHGHHEHREHEHHEHERKHTFVIYVDDVRYEVHHAHRTGAELKALAQRPTQYQLFQERPGEPDLLVSDAQVVAMKDGEHFYTIPPAQFG